MTTPPAGPQEAKEPKTKAGRALAQRAEREAFGNWEGIRQFEIPAIEQEAAVRGGAPAALREALEEDVGRQQYAVKVMQQRGYVMDMDLSKSFDDLTEAERWQKLAFTFYTDLCESASRAEHVLEDLSENTVDSLDDALAAAEAALPEGAWIEAVGNARLGYNVRAWINVGHISGELAHATAGPLPAALTDLAARLTATSEEETNG